MKALARIDEVVDLSFVESSDLLRCTLYVKGALACCGCSFLIGGVLAMRLLILFTSLIILLPADLWAQEPDVLTPEESVQRALEEHGLLRSAEAQAREARAAYQQARSAWCHRSAARPAICA